MHTATHRATPEGALSMHSLSRRFSRSLWLAALVLLTLMLSTPAAHAGPEIIGATDTDRIFDVAKNYGNVSLDIDRDGDPKIVGRIDGTRYTIFFYGCRNGRNCTDLMFYAAWQGGSKSMEQINDWNRTQRLSKAIIERDGRLALQMPLNLRHGVTRGNLESTFDWWKDMLGTFVRTLSDGS
jgi:hypothetical protein